ncbi:MAG: hypothetical protein ACK4HW_01575 [Roseinatronobacter sp.]
MTTRLIALVLLGLLVGFVGVMASVSVFVRDPLPLVGPNQTLLLHSVDLTPRIRSSVTIDGGYRVELTVEDSSPLPPRVTLQPTGGSPIPLDAGPDANGVWSASGQLTRPGRWELVMVRGQTREVLSFIVRE